MTLLDEIRVIQRHASSLWKFASRYLDNIRAGEDQSQRFQDCVTITRDNILATTHAMSSANQEAAKTRKRKLRSGEHTMPYHSQPAAKRWCSILEWELLTPNESDRAGDSYEPGTQTDTD